MYAVVTQATIHDLEKARTVLNEQGVPRMKQAPGFVAGTWVHLDETHGRGIVVFESEDTARAGAEMIRANSPAGDAVTVDSVEVGEVVARV
jgi:hypothetical protein